MAGLAQGTTYNPIAANDWLSPEFRTKCNMRLNALDTARWSWWISMRELARFINPRLGRFLETPNVSGRGRPKNQAIYNNTATISSNRMASGLMAGVCSPASPWWRPGIGRTSYPEGSPVKLWLNEVYTRMSTVLSESNFYRSIATLFEDISTFGTGVMITYEDYEDIMRCVPVAAGQYYLAVDERLQPTTLGRKIVMTVQEIVGQFGFEKCSKAVQDMYTAGSMSQENMIGHLIMPNDQKIWGALGIKGMPYIEAYWELGSGENAVLRVKGYHDRPFCAARWTVTGNDAYGRGAGWDAISDVKQLQIMEKRLAQAIDKMVNPPMVGPTTLKDSQASVLPGALTYLPVGQEAQFKSVYDMKLDIGAMESLIGKVENRIKTTFYEDLFMMISQLDTVRTATEIVARKEEKMLMLGPALERLHDELLRITIERLFGMMHRAGLLPVAPPEVRGSFMSIEFVSTLAQAQKAASTAAIERMFQFVGGLAAIWPEARDKLDPDQAIDEYADDIGTAPQIVVSAEKVAAVRAARAKQANAATTLQTGVAAAQGAQTLSQTDVGGGQNALQKMLGQAA